MRAKKGFQTGNEFYNIPEFFFDASKSTGKNEENYFDILNNTGIKPLDSTKIIEVEIERYKIKIELTSDDKFVRVLEIKVKKNFRGLDEKTQIGDMDDIRKYFIK